MTARLYPLALIACCTLSPNAWSSSHHDGPHSALDAQAETTDVYLFISPNDSDRIVLAADSVPHAHGFDNDVAYEICIDNDGDAFATSATAGGSSLPRTREARHTSRCNKPTTCFDSTTTATEAGNGSSPTTCRSHLAAWQK